MMLGKINLGYRANQIHIASEESSIPAQNPNPQTRTQPTTVFLQAHPIIEPESERRLQESR
jgi:hypothetical protein